MSLRDDAATWCEFIRPDRTCTLMEALESEPDARCRYWRDEPGDCRYLRHVVLKGAVRRGKT